MPTKNLPNEPGSWDGDFSYDYLGRLYAALQARFRPAVLSEIAEPGTGRVFVRHDIDLSLARALPLARLENARGLRATYHVMLDSPFYDVRTEASRAALAELAALGHEVGLHYDVVARRMREAPAVERDADIARAAEELEALTRAPVKSLSFHLPIPELVRGPLHVAGRVSGYAKELLGWYLSDSRARWREGEPLASLDAPRAPDLQILVHPIWWGERHVAPGKRLATFLDEVGPGLGMSYAELNELLWEHVIYQADERSTSS